MKKPKNRTEEDEGSWARTTGAPIYFKTPPVVDGVYQPMSDAELERVREYPDWVWGGLADAHKRLLARLDAKENS